MDFAIVLPCTSHLGCQRRYYSNKTLTLEAVLANHVSRTMVGNALLHEHMFLTPIPLLNTLPSVLEQGVVILLGRHRLRQMFFRRVMLDVVLLQVDTDC